MRAVRQGVFQATAEVRTPVTGDSLKEFFLGTQSRSQRKSVEKDLRDAKSYLTEFFRSAPKRRRFDESARVAAALRLPADYLQTYRDKVNA
jgi:hypothetical protein